VAAWVFFISVAIGGVKLMEEYQKNYNEEASMILLGRLAMEMPLLEVDMQQQLKIKRVIDEVLYKYEVKTKQTALVTSDIVAKAKLYLACKKLEGLSSKTIYNYILQLKQFRDFFHKPVSIQWLQNEEYIISNPTKKIKPIKEPHRERTPLTDEQVEIIRDGLIGRRDKAIIEFLLSTGCRVGELVNIEIGQVDWFKMSLLVIGKGNKQRKVFFNERTKIALNKYLESRKGESIYLFCGERRPHNKLTTRAIQNIINKIAVKTNININLHPHIFRHTFATRALSSGMPIEIVQALLGHEKIDTTQVYAKVKETNVEYMYRRIV